jgi:hypothetical protein
MVGTCGRYFSLRARPWRDERGMQAEWENGENFLAVDREGREAGVEPFGGGKRWGFACRLTSDGG